MACKRVPATLCVARESSKIVMPLVWSARKRASEEVGSIASHRGFKHYWGFAEGRTGASVGLKEILAIDEFRKMAVYGSSEGTSDKEPHRAQVTHVKEKLFEDWTNPAKEDWDKEFIWVRY